MTVTVYSPTGSCESRNCPDSLLVAVYFCWVAAMVATTVAPGMRALEGSLTWPVISAVFIWADTAAALNRRAAARTAAAQNEAVHRATNTWRSRLEGIGAT